MNLRFPSFVVLSASAILASCAHWDRGPGAQSQPFVRTSSAPGARLNRAEAVAIAKAEAVRRGIDLGGYQEPNGSYEDGVWFTTFESATPTAPLGGHFTISVNERLDTTFYGPGR